MKSPNELANRLARQWHRASLRAERLLSEDSWPLELNIGKPSAQQFIQQPALVHEHLQKWKSDVAGKVIWQPIKYRHGAEAVELPVKWSLSTPSEWIAACGDPVVSNEYRALEFMVKQVKDVYWDLLVRERMLWRGKDLTEVVETAMLADSLFPGAAQGRPLRLLAGLGVDTKFIERNRQLLTRLLDERFQGEASEQGLLAFLDGYEENDHWVLVVPLAPGLLPFQRQRITTQELAQSTLAVSNILVVENEQCVHHLPELPDTIAILGSGMDLLWLSSSQLANKNIGYWGDMDTWGLFMLARARQYANHIMPVMMNKVIFERYQERAVVEKTTAGCESPVGLTVDEILFYQFLLGNSKGRLEQEFVPVEEAQAELKAWRLSL